MNSSLRYVSPEVLEKVALGVIFFQKLRGRGVTELWATAGRLVSQSPSFVKRGPSYGEAWVCFNKPNYRTIDDLLEPDICRLLVISGSFVR